MGGSSSGTGSPVGLNNPFSGSGGVLAPDGGDWNPFSNVKNWSGNAGGGPAPGTFGAPGSQGTGTNQLPNNPSYPGNPIGPLSGLPGHDGHGSYAGPSGTDPTIGQLADPLRRDKNGGILPGLAVGLGEFDHYNAKPLHEIESMTSPGAMTSDSPWAQSQFNQIDRNTAGMRDASKLNAMSSVQGASDSAATHGGLTGGGAARIGAMGMMNQANGDQAASLYGAQSKDQTRATDYGQKMNLLSQVPGMEGQRAQYQSNVEGANTDSILKGENMVNNNTLTKYGQDMNKFIGTNLANATAASGKKK